MNPTLEQTAFDRAMSIFSCPQSQYSERELLMLIGVLVARGTPNIPYYNKQEITYIGSTNNIQSIVYKDGNTVVATQTFTYVGSGASDNDKVATITIE